MKIQLPEKFKNWYDKDTQITKSSDNSLFVFEESIHSQVSVKMAEQMKKEGTTENPKHTIAEFLNSSSFKVKINIDGILDLPLSLSKHLNKNKILEFKELPHYLVIK